MKYIKIFSLSAFVLLLIVVSFTLKHDNTHKNKPITLEEAGKLIDNNINNPNFVIIDVRTPEEFSSWHIENAINIDFQANDFANKVSKLDKNKTYLVYCKIGARSNQAISIFEAQGLRNIYHLKDGISSIEPR